MTTIDRELELHAACEAQLLAQLVDAERLAAAYAAAMDSAAEILRKAIDDPHRGAVNVRVAFELLEDARADMRQRRGGVERAANALVAECFAAAMAGGWWTDLATGESLIGRRNVGETLMLIVSEIAEAMEGHRKGLMDDHLPDRPMIEVELADALIRICDLAGAMGLDLGGAVAAKLDYNARRADHKPEARKAAGGKSY